MNKRLSFEQKAEAIYNLLGNAGRSMSAWEIGRELGYSSNKPIRDTLTWMLETERAKGEVRNHRFGEAMYYRINPAYVQHRQDSFEVT